ncbi:MAG: phosphoribosyltransferase family protein [Saprospiraceae bacterium]|nr:phosphoribosyltransferase family protein [Saprospiraceae bacterium]
MKILDKQQIQQKIKRLAIEILENNFDETRIILGGINNNGMSFAKLLRQELKTITQQEILLTQIKLNPANPLAQEVTIGMPIEELENASLVIVDDVANTGRTIFYAIKPLLETLPRKVCVAVLVDRKHKSFPIKVDYLGLSLATTLKEDIEVNIRDTKDWAVYLR